MIDWLFVLGASALPLIIWSETTGSDAAFPVAVGQSAFLAALVAVAPRVESLRARGELLRWLLALSLGWHVMVSGVTGLAAWEAWQESVPWIARGAVVQALIFAPSLLLVVLGVGRRSRQELRLTRGDPGAPSHPDVINFGRRPTWLGLGAFWAAGVTVGTFTAMYFALGSEAEDFSRLLVAMPAVLILAATNTINEEFQFRNVPLAFLATAENRLSALVMTALFFGLEHFYGNPPGASGVVLAGFLGYIMGKSMLETNGSTWAWAIHWVQDVVIFSFLVLAWPM